MVEIKDMPIHVIANIKIIKTPRLDIFRSFIFFITAYLLCVCCAECRRTVCVTCVWAGVDSVWEQEKLEARKMLENAAESHTSGARFVRRL